ncbi:lipocalin family protein [Capnocytophaga felis]|uniref:Lipocalin-like domain-containing protein n=1 Tax=Capnocytophaga felis TaxID=2267611 RepID=A0A5M4BBJ5_9FLAO|nr:lipocalin family protein [Capnocytophaga felis]GET46702.1 hypothetical protein RCZ01_20040 [Capnocytophaga felis]
MKKIIMLAFVALGTLVISCGKDEDASLEGTWYLESASENGVAFPIDECMKKSYNNFSSKTYTTVLYSKNDNGECVEDEQDKGSYVVSGDTITLTNTNNETLTFTYSIKGSTLTTTHKEMENGKELIIVQVFKKK